MKGVVFNLLEAVIRRDYGDDTWEALLEAAETDGAYSSLGNYPDEEVMKLVGAASSALNMPADDVVRWFGRDRNGDHFDRSSSSGYVLREPHVEIDGQCGCAKI